MTTERDIRNQIAYAEEKGIEKGRQEERVRIADRLRQEGFAEETIANLMEG